MDARQQLGVIERCAREVGQPLTGAGGLFPNLPNPVTTGEQAVWGRGNKSAACWEVQSLGQLSTFVSRATHAVAHASLRDLCVLTLRAALRNLWPAARKPVFEAGMSTRQKLDVIEWCALEVGQPLTGAGGLLSGLLDPVTSGEQAVWGRGNKSAACWEAQSLGQ